MADERLNQWVRADVVESKENAAYDAGYADGVADRQIPKDAIGEVWVHDEFPSDDPVKTFYEVPDQIAEVVRSASAARYESFAACLHNLTLEREGAQAEVKRLTRALKEGRSGR